MAKENKIIMYLGVAAIIVLALSLLGFVDISKMSITGDGTKQVVSATGQIPTTSCNSATSTSTTFSILDAYGNDVTSDYNLALKINGNEVAAQSVAGTAVSFSPNDVVEYKAVQNGATHNVYGFSGSYTVPCKTTDKVTLTKGMQDTAVTGTMYDISTGNDNGTNSDTTTETLGAGATAKGRVYLAATTNDGVWSTTENGREYGIAIDYNNLVYKQPIITSVSDGTFEVLTGTPTGHIAVSQLANANATVFYVVKSSALNDLGSISVKFQAEALTGTTNPTSVDGNIAVTLYDAEMYQRSDGSRAWVTGFRNADTGADLGETNVTTKLYVN